VLPLQLYKFNWHKAKMKTVLPWWIRMTCVCNLLPDTSGTSRSVWIYCFSFISYVNICYSQITLFQITVLTLKLHNSVTNALV
jgi:hypothetical protein